jgi:ribonuclease PH
LLLLSTSDLNYAERSSDTPELACASLVHSSKIVCMQQENKMHSSQLAKLVELALEGNKKIYEILKEETKKYSEAILKSRGIING